MSAAFSSFPLARRRPSRKTSRFKPLMGARQAAVRTRSGYFLGCSAYRARRSRHIALFIHEVKILVVSLNCVRHQHLGFTFAGFGFAAYVPIAVNKVQILLVVPFKMKFFDLFCHILLECK